MKNAAQLRCSPYLLRPVGLPADGACGAEYFHDCSNVVECEPDQSKSRVHSAEWMAVAFKPAAMVWCM